MATPEKTPSKDQLIQLRIDAIRETDPDFEKLTDCFEQIVTQYMVCSQALSEILIKRGLSRADAGRAIDSMVKKPAGIKDKQVGSCRVYAKMKYRGIGYHKRLAEDS